MIARQAIVCLALAQLISWGVSYYLIGVFGELIAADLGWERDIVYGGYAAALLTMGIASPMAGRLVDRYGGRAVMISGALVIAGSCAVMSLCRNIPGYYVAWICLGLAMRLSLYDAAFATLARIGGAAARRPMSQITLLGGLASTTFWPVGHFLAEQFGWRGAVGCYAVFALLAIPLLATLPRGTVRAIAKPPLRAAMETTAKKRHRLTLCMLFAFIMAVTTFLSSAMSAHMIGILAGVGLSMSAAVWAASLRGIGQSAARLCEVLFGARVDPPILNLIATAILPISFLCGLQADRSPIAAAVFAFSFGMGNGLLTITRGTLPLVLFDHHAYGLVAGRLVAPSFLFSAAAPLVYALIGAKVGEAGMLSLSFVLAVLAVVAAACLARLHRRRSF